MKRFFYTAILLFGTVFALQAQAKDQDQDQPSKKAPAEVQFTLDVKVLLGDGRSVLGKLLFQAPEKIVVRHMRDGIAYEKPVKILDLRSVEFGQWKGSPVKKNSQGQVFQFDVSRFVMVLRDETVLEKMGDVFPFFRNLVLENKYGQVKLFSYWLDLQRKAGGWHTGLSGPSNGYRVVSHKDVVKKIEFVKE